jgi:hypothetical protein
MTTRSRTARLCYVEASAKNPIRVSHLPTSSSVQEVSLVAKSFLLTCKALAESPDKVRLEHNSVQGQQISLMTDALAKKVNRLQLAAEGLQDQKFGKGSHKGPFRKLRDQLRAPVSAAKRSLTGERSEGTLQSIPLSYLGILVKPGETQSQMLLCTNEDPYTDGYSGLERKIDGISTIWSKLTKNDFESLIGTLSFAQQVIKYDPLSAKDLTDFSGTYRSGLQPTENRKVVHDMISVTTSEP